MLKGSFVVEGPTGPSVYPYAEIQSLGCSPDSIIFGVLFKEDLDPLSGGRSASYTFPMPASMPNGIIAAGYELLKTVPELTDAEEV